ncbi:diguanylate cyclase [Neiella marina]|uniref:diguanylate cyclase n=1 Tax=Neiella holothuriorum TaxID=2870530 RepID=A0ABS7EBX2_9GAMM|nr:diguanylate cyclase [Neiella holothuriorum]MBW8189828.1 diguanylate cyclase [Neiella holothuriorum]
MLKQYIFCFCMFFIFSGVGYSAEQTDSSQLIDEAVSLRSSSKGRLTEIVQVLKSRDLSREEQEYLTYLEGYLLAAQGSFKNSGKVIEGLLETSVVAEVRVLSTTLLVNVNAAQGNWSKGLASTQVLTLHMQELNKSSNLYQNALAVKGVFYNQIEQFELGLASALELFSIASGDRQTCAAANLIIESSNRLNKPLPDSTIPASAFEACQSYKVLEAFTATYMAERHLLESKHSDVIALLESRVTFFNQTKYPPLILNGFYALAKAYWQQGLVAKAEQLLEQLLAMDVANSNKAKLADVLLLLAKIRYSQGQLGNAFELMQRHVKLREQYLNDVTAKRLAFQLAQQHSIEKDNEIKLLAANKLLLAAETENNRLLILLLSLVLILLCLYVFRSHRNQQRLRQLAEFDALTGVHNRGHFTQLAKSALQFSQDSKKSVAVVLFDLDLFKKVNDTYGHACGDWVLKQVAGVCQELTRKNDVFARVGGEEFCFLLLGCDSHTALDVAEKCRRAIYGIDTKKSGFDFKVSGSFGVSDNQLSGYNLDRILADADEALYCAKSSGRNTVYLYDPGAEQTALLRPDGSLVS